MNTDGVLYWMIYKITIHFPSHTVLINRINKNVAYYIAFLYDKEKYFNYYIDITTLPRTYPFISKLHETTIKIAISDLAYTSCIIGLCI